jgi:exodeoxyribonuclease V gamma subunit
MGMALEVHRSNRMERLVDVLARLVAQPAGSAMQPECIVVQGRGMERWLAQELARRLGVWANPDFPFPRHLLLRAIGAILGEENAEGDPFQPETLLWAIADILPQYLELPSFAPVRHYLAGDDRLRRRLELASRIAQTFDQYVVYRPAMVLDWERGRDDHWQAHLWRALTQRLGRRHMAARAGEAVAQLRAGKEPPAGFPQRISFFGVSTLPPLYLEVIASLAQVLEVHLFVPSPSREYWADIRSQRARIRELMRLEAPGGSALLEASPGHPLLGSLGRVGRDFQQLLECADYTEDGTDLYVEPQGGTMLATVQADVLALRWRGDPAAEASPLILQPGDESIQVHNCHSPMREIEVLYDQLLAAFEADSTLQPHEVVVMTPAIETYAPFIEAVFGGRSDETRIPFRIADRQLRASDGVVDAFLRVLEVPSQRLTAAEVLDLLALDPIRTRFGISLDDLEVLRQWVGAAGVRWAANATHRAAVEQPPLAEGTWRFGLDRLLLGYAMAGEERTLYGGVLPFDAVEGSQAAALGHLADYCERLFVFHAAAQSPRPLPAWSEILGSLLDDLIAAAEDQVYAAQQIRGALARLAERAAAAGFAGTVDLQTLRAQLHAELQAHASSRGFLAGGVTFCALVPMRSIPFRVVVLLGMNDADFPRRVHAPGFDLMARQPRFGDRTARDDDRYLFLEALLAARERLLITYVGQSARDGSEIPASVVVSELLDTLEGSFRTDSAAGSDRAEETVHAHVVLVHPLQGFSPRYFEPHAARGLFSYAGGRCEGARRLQGARVPPRPFLDDRIPLDDTAARAVTVDQLVRFFEHPARFFLQQRLQLRLGRDSEPLNEREPLQLNALERWQIGDRLLRLQAGGEVPESVTLLRAMGLLPPGQLGIALCDEILPEVAALTERLRALHSGAPLASLEVDAELEGTRVVGVLRDLWPAGLVRVQFSQVGRRQEVGMWVRHLILNWAAPAVYPRDSLLVGRAKTAGRSSAKKGPVAIVRFPPRADAPAILADLLGLFWRGQERLLPFFPKASRMFIEQLAKSGADEEQILESVNDKFMGLDGDPGEGHDPYVRQALGGCDLVDALDAMPNGREEFAHVARTIFAPLLEARRETL